MDFVSIRVITDDVARLAGFYEKATGVRATWYNEDFAELGTAHATLAIGSTRTVPLFAPGAARPARHPPRTPGSCCRWPTPCAITGRSRSGTPPPTAGAANAPCTRTGSSPTQAAGT